MAVLIDAPSRSVVGWLMAEHLQAELVIKALQIPVGVQPLTLPGLGSSLDYGNQYTFLAFGQRLEVGLLMTLLVTLPSGLATLVVL